MRISQQYYRMMNNGIYSVCGNSFMGILYNIRHKGIEGEQNDL